MKFLVVGLGSMGKRRIRNLQQIKAGDILGFDPVKERRREVEKRFNIKTFNSFEEAMKEEPDAIIVSTPPDLHVKYGMEAVKNGKHFFLEASVVDWGMDELIKEVKKRDIVAAPSCTMRFHPSIKMIKQLVEEKSIGVPLMFTYHSGQYLPDWHPWEDYRKFYVAKKETGAAREIVAFELVWLTWIFGEVEEISCFKGKLSKLDVDIDDVYQIIMKFKSGTLGHVLVDVISRIPDRNCKIFGEEGTILWDWGRGVQVYIARDKSWKAFPEISGTTVEGYAQKIKEEPYVDEISTFVRAIKKEIKYPYTLEEDKKILEILYNAEKSSIYGEHIKVKY